MCIAVPVEIMEIYENHAVARFEGVKMKIDISLVENLHIGEYVLLHAGCAVQKVDEGKAQETLKLFQELAKVKWVGSNELP